jgi:hypothetical protein
VKYAWALAVIAANIGAAAAQSGDAAYDAAFQHYGDLTRRAEAAMHDVEVLPQTVATGPKSEACIKAGRLSSLYDDALQAGEGLPRSNSVSAGHEMDIAAQLEKTGREARRARTFKRDMCKGG